MLDGNNITLKLIYEGYGFPLRLSLAAEEDEYVVQANIHTLEAEAVNFLIHFKIVRHVLEFLGARLR